MKSLQPVHAVSCLCNAQKVLSGHKKTLYLIYKDNPRDHNLNQEYNVYSPNNTPSAINI